jgi:putative flippase GtrA
MSPREITAFLAVGAGATALQYAVYAAGLAFTRWPAAASSAAGYLAGSVLSYVLNYHVTFRSVRRHAVALPKFYAMVGAAFVLNAGLVAMLVDAGGVNAWLGQVAATGACLVFNYLVSRSWVFKGES